MRKLVFASLIAAIALSAGNPAHPHGGGLDSSGCHTDSKTGKRHCHKRKGATQGGTDSIAPTPVTLLSVGDGDTVRVTDKTGTKITIRLACIDAPETSQGASGKWSTQILKGLLQGKSISIKPQVQDRYGRTVAEIYQGSTNINLKMVKLGAAFSLSQVPQAV